jgi:acetyl-CoA C-acetyltransferase
MENVYIVSATRSPIGAFGGALSSVSAIEMGKQCIQSVIQKAEIKVDEIDEVILGNVLSAGAGMGPARQASIAGGIPESVPAYTLNMICGSGMKAIMEAVSHIRAGDAEVVLAGGMENMSESAYVVPGNIRQGVRFGNQAMIDTMMNDGLTDAFAKYPMGVTAENIANKLDISREAQDAFALQSQQKAVAAMQNGGFTAEITPITFTHRRKERIVEVDEYPKADATLAGLQGLRPAFAKEGSVTAGNSSGINDGAAVVLVASESAVKRLGLQPLVKIISTAQAGIDPAIMGLGPVPAIEKALTKVGLNLSEIELLELNEAFAVQSLGVINQLAEQHQCTEESLLSRTNCKGGAIALGHPIGASGSRIVVTLIHQMLEQKSRYGLASLCIGGGMGTAMIFEQA